MPRWLFITLVLVANFLVSEVICFAVFRFAQSRFTFRESFDFDPALIPKYVRGFDAELGWRRRHDTELGERPRTNPTGRPLIATFGESYVAGADIDNEETWQNALSSRLGADVLNFGVGGHGPDQSLLYYQKLASQLRTPIVLLGLVPDSIGRIVHVYRNMLVEQDPIPLTKPRFELKDGQLSLFPNYLKSAEQAAELRIPEVLLRELGPHDVWLQRSEMVLRNLPSFSFPYSRLAFSPGIWRQLVTRHPTDPEYPYSREEFWASSGHTELFFAILDRFVEEVRAQGGHPLIVLMPQRTAIQRSLENAELIGEKKFDEYCELRQAPCLNSVKLFISWLSMTRKTGRLQSYFTQTHLSPLGNELFANLLEDHLRGPAWAEVIRSNQGPRRVSHSRGSGRE